VFLFILKQKIPKNSGDAGGVMIRPK
jgi:hypothetical protein